MNEELLPKTAIAKTVSYKLIVLPIMGLALLIGIIFSNETFSMKIESHLNEGDIDKENILINQAPLDMTNYLRMRCIIFSFL